MFQHGNQLKICLPPRIFKFSPEPAKFCLEENKVLLNASICDVMMVKSLLRVDPTQSYGENTKKNLIKDFIDFAMKKKIQNWFSLFQFKITKI